MSCILRAMTGTGPQRLKPLLPAIVCFYLSTHSLQAVAAEDYVPEVRPLDLNQQFNERKAKEDTGEEEPSASEDDEKDDIARIAVNGFTFRTLTEFPEYGITRNSVEELAENLRQEYMEKSASGDSDAAEGMSYEEIESVARRVTRFYRERGVLLAKAYIPPQEVNNGTVELDILIGRLGEVSVTENEKYDTELLQAEFAGQLGKAVKNPEIERGLYLLNDYPGLDVYGFFEKGDNPGETRLNLQVREEKSWDLTIYSDNHGSELTGEKRLYLVGNWNNPTGGGDQLTLGGLRSFSPENSDLVQVGYSFPVSGADTRLKLYAERNDYNISSDDDPALDELKVYGAGETYSMTLMHQLVRSRVSNLATGLTYSSKKAERGAAIDGVFAEGDRTRSVTLVFEGDKLASSIQALTADRLSLQYGRLRNDVPEDRGDDYYKLSLDTSSLFYLPIPFSESESRLLLKSRWRYANTALPSYEQMSLAGANAVRAFELGEFSADNGVYLGAELYFDVPDAVNFQVAEGINLNDVFQYAVFMEAAYGSENSYKFTPDDVERSDPRAHLAGAGVLLRLNWMDRISSTLTVATPITTASSNDLAGEHARDWQTYIDLTLRLD